MTHLDRLCLTLAIIFVSLACGYWLRRFMEGRAMNIGRLDRWRKLLQSVAVFALLPLAAMLSLWGLPSPGPGLLYLPFLGLLSYLWGGWLAILIARLIKLTPAQTGSFYCCGTFTNLGAVGGLVCLLFLGENTIAMVALYRLLEEVYYFGVSFPIAEGFGNGAKAKASRKFAFHPVIALIIIALGTGIGLNLAGVVRPGYLGNVAYASVLVSTIFFIFAIGLSLRISAIGRYWRPCAWMCVIKFIAQPAVVIACAAILGLGAIEGGLPLKTCAILSCMPVAMTALVPPSLFDLDLDLANSCWIITTAALIFVLPAIMFVLPHL